ncbi:ankyrin repeat-containing domain protein [Ilyonectria destructans]|nr:ankyrin repeat-containing domain protein [Ilyonectria destructans]
MAEVLGAVASSIALAEVALKTLSFLREIKGIQGAFEDLRQQITILGDLVRCAQTIPGLIPFEDSAQPSPRDSPICRTATQLKEVVDELDKIAVHCARTTFNKTSVVKKLQWIRSAHEIEHLCEKVRDAKSNLHLAIQLHQGAIQFHQSAMLTQFRTEILTQMEAFKRFQPSLLRPKGPSQIQELAKNSVSITASQPHDGNTDGDENIEDDVDDTPIMNLGLGHSTLSSGNGTLATSVRDSSHVKLRTFVPLSRSQYLKGSRCQCHSSQQRYQSATWFQPLLGSYFFRYHTVGSQERFPRKRECNCREGTYLTMEYRLPQWLLAQMVLFKGSYGHSMNLSCEIRPTRILPSFYDVWAQTSQPVHIFQAAIEHGNVYFPDDQDELGQGLLEYAIASRAFEMVEVLQNEWRNMLLNEGLSGRVVYQVNFALKMWDDLTDQEVNILQQVKAWAYYGTDLTTKVHEAVMEGRGLADAIQRDRWAVNALDDTGHTPLHLAAYSNQVEAIEQLIAEKADVDAKDWEGWSPLMCAVVSGNLECMKPLLEAKCQSGQRAENGKMVLHRAVAEGSLKAVQLLLATGASTSAWGVWNETALHALALSPSDLKTTREILNLLSITKDFDLEAREDGGGTTPTVYAMAYSNLTVLRCLVEIGGSLHAVIDGSRNMLHIAAIYCSSEILDYLIKLELIGISTELRDEDGDTPWDCFCYVLNIPEWALGQFRRPALDEQQSFVRLYRGIRDRNLQHDIQILVRLHAALLKEDEETACVDLAVLIKEKTELKMDGLAGYYRGIRRQIQEGRWESPIAAVEDDLEDLKAELESSPWEKESKYDSIKRG